VERCLACEADSVGTVGALPRFRLLPRPRDYGATGSEAVVNNTDGGARLLVSWALVRTNKHCDIER
jgi:hypothetical protein